MSVKRRGKIVIAAATLIAIVAAIAVSRPNERDPVYKGHHFSEWLGCFVHYIDIEKRFNPPTAELRDAVVTVGTTNLQLLTTWIARDTSPTVFDKARQIMPNWLRRLFKRQLEAEDYRYETAEGAADAFKLLGVAGTPVIPQLAQTVRIGNEQARARALRALVFIGKPALPSLLEIAATPKLGDTRVEAIGFLSQYINDTTVRIFLANAATNTNGAVASAAQDALRGENNFGY
ncbi:MAG: hypothetical protein JWO95_3240 [Verrucomicrobiales bacterium]|nr:hypothetical protein [Verrucomicrobiales bacterium]